jgi:alpha,alpha-trehalose phosphorylase
VLRHRGALYPWRTINGDEASAYFPAGTAQYHINADVVYAMGQYVRATGDRSFLLAGGAEMLFETARFWIDLGCFIDGKGFCINKVTGPDEYTALVSNNTYTNLMAADHLRYAAATFNELADAEREWFARLSERLGLKASEPQEWLRASEAIYVPYNSELGIHGQDETFLGLAEWDFEGTPAERYPLLMHYHPLTIYRHQVLKQPDVVLAMLLQGDKFDQPQKRRNFEYYDRLTTADSSLAPCIQSIIAAEIGEIDLSYRYFMRTARMDLDDINGNVADGVHTAAMAGTWLSIVFGFAGMRDFSGQLSFNPRLPGRWSKISFRILWRGTRIQVSVGPESTTYRLPDEGEAHISHWGKAVTLAGSGETNLRNAPEV